MFNELESDIHALFVASIAIIAVLNPFGNLPQFIEMTDGIKPPIRKKLFRNIVFTSFCIVLVFLFSGSFIMHYLFRVTLSDVRIAGGIILITMGLKNFLFSSSTHEVNNYQHLRFDELFHKSIIPMAFPMLVGPGSLSTIIVIAEDKNILVATGAIICAFLFMFLLFHYAATIEKVFGKLILYICSRIALVFIIAMGVKMIISGFKGYGIIN